MYEELIVADTETASIEGGVCDLAVVVLDRNFNQLAAVESLIDPERPISPQASGIHHITDEMVAHEPTMAEFLDLYGNPFDRPNPIIGGHNIQFDIRVLGDLIPAEHRKLCTLKLARILWPDAPDHKLQTLRYMFRLDAGDAHRAMGDVRVCVSLLRMVRDQMGHDLESLMGLLSKPISLDTKMPFGKHQGEALKDLPISYVRWALANMTTLDNDLREALASRIN